MNIILGGTHGLGWELASKLRESGEDTHVIDRTKNQTDSFYEEVIERGSL
jgi:NAD(P)-dependent dehydrogenase (short-subunit alcohol dehydrogenase family)